MLSSRLLSFITGDLLAGEKGRDVRADTPLLSAGMIDSLALTELLLFIERETGITIPEDEIAPDNFETVNAMTAMIGRLTASV